MNLKLLVALFACSGFLATSALRASPTYIEKDLLSEERAQPVGKGPAALRFHRRERFVF